MTVKTKFELIGRWQQSLHYCAFIRNEHEVKISGKKGKGK